MKQLTFTATIKAPRELVWNTMLDPASYREWTKPFMDGSYYEGSWDEGATIRFLSPSGEGMVATIVRNEPHTFISIRHLGFVANGRDDTTSEAATSWAPAHENYRFEARFDNIRARKVVDYRKSYMQFNWAAAEERQ